MSIGPPPTLRELGSYELLEKIAEGGMGAVFKGRPKGGGEVIAIKVLPPDTARNATLLKRFEQEFRAATLIDHPNVVKAIEYSGPTPNTPAPFLVMEYVDGCSLGTLIEQSGPLAEADAVHIIAQVCDGLHCAHKQGLIHRDVKPDNVIVTADRTAKLTDLGLVRDVESDDNLTRTGKGLGTPYFMAPEQFRNAKHVDARSDVYSLGATLYMMLTGQAPFAKCSPLDCWMKKTKDEFPAPKALNPRISDRLDFAVRRAMRANPAERPNSCREFMEDVLGEAWKGRSGAASGSFAPLPAAAGELWYMVFHENGVARTVKGDTETIRRNIRAGVLGDLTAVLISRTKSGPFAHLKSVPEFRDLVFNEAGGSSRSRIPAVRPAEPERHARSTPMPEQTPLPERVPAPPSRGYTDQAAKRTDALPMVPTTNRATLHLGTDERPPLPTGRTRPHAPAADPEFRLPWWAWVAVGVALASGFLAGFLMR